MTNFKNFSVHRYLLKPLTKLKKLYLNNNQIATIEQSAFVGLSSVEIIELQNNELTLKGDGQLAMGSPFQTLGYLTDLNLANNSITQLFEDYTLLSMKTLNLSHNLITVLSTSELESLSKNGVVMDFTFNQIEEFQFEESVDTLQAQINVLLNNNPIKCDCKILNFVRYLEKRNNRTEKMKGNIDIDVGDLKCLKPENMADKLISTIKPSELICPLDDETTTKKLCPNECTCFVRPEDRHYLLDCSSELDVRLLPIASERNYELVELKMENGDLTELPKIMSQGYSQVTELLLRNNSIKNIKAEYLPPKLRVLDLRDNKLETLSKAVMNFTDMHIQVLNLSGNPWSCECSNRDFFNFVQKNGAPNSKISTFSEIKCKNGKHFNTLTSSDLCPDDNLFVVIISIVTALMGLVLGGLAALYYKYQKQIKMWLYSHNMCLWFVTEEEMDKVCGHNDFNIY